MIRAYRSEWQKLLRPGILLTAALVAGLGVLGAVIGVSRARADGVGAYTLQRLAESDGFFQIMTRGSTVISLLSLGIVAAAVAMEYQHGTLRNLLVRQPQRLRLLAGKLLANLSALALILCLSVSTALGAALIATRVRGVDTSAWFSGSGLVSLGDAYGDTLLMGLGFGVAGGLLALVLRSVAPAIVAGFAWLVPVEALLVLAWSSLQPWLPGQALAALGTGGTAALPFTHALLGAALWLAGLAAVSAAVFRRRDVVA